MKRRIEKLIALMLSVVMLAGALPVSVWAEQTSVSGSPENFLPGARISLRSTSGHAKIKVRKVTEKGGTGDE